jgi:membrane protein
VGIYNRADEHHIFLNASGLAFSLFICIMPLLLIIFALLGEILARPSINDQIYAFIDRAIPYAEYADYVKAMVTERVVEFTTYKREAGVIGFVGLTFAATGLFSGMRTVLNTVFRVKTSESILIAKLRDLLLVIVVMLFVLLSTTLLPMLDVVLRSLSDVPGVTQAQRWLMGGLPVDIVSLGLIFASFLFIYYAVPQVRPTHGVALVGALSAAILWFIAKEAFGFYVSHVVTLKRVYGAYTLLIVVAFWIYYTAIVFIIGAEIGQLHGERVKMLRERTVPPS